MEKVKRPLISIAPMVVITYITLGYQLITSRATVYTQMIHHNAILHHHKTILPFNPSQHPIVLQLGGCDPTKLADAAQIGIKYGYDQINLNVGCPSPRVQSGSFGACLMKQPKLVYQCIKQIRQRVKGTPCTIKCRLGVDQFDTYDFVKKFVHTVSENGNVQHFIIHARKAILKGLNPAQNRKVPLLQYEKVYKLKQDFPHLKFTINGGIQTLSKAKLLLDQHNLQGCMIGRTAYQNPYQLIQTDSKIYGQNMDKNLPTRQQILLKYADYLDRVQSQGYFNQIELNNNGHLQQIDPLLGLNINTIKYQNINPSQLIKPIINMYHGKENNSSYKKILSDSTKLKNQLLSNVIKQAINAIKSKNKQSNQKQFDNLHPIQHLNGDNIFVDHKNV